MPLAPCYCMGDRGHCYKHLKKIKLRWKLSPWIYLNVCVCDDFELPEMAKKWSFGLLSPNLEPALFGNGFPGTELLQSPFRTEFSVGSRVEKWRVQNQLHALHVIALHILVLHVIVLHVIALHVIALHVIALHVIALHCMSDVCQALHLAFTCNKP